VAIVPVLPGIGRANLRQRIGIAQALLNDPRQLIVDEPKPAWTPRS